MDNTPYLIKFKTSMIEFIDELIKQFPKEPSFVLVRIFVNDKLLITDVMGRFMKECLPYKNIIKKRDANFFIYSDFIYEQYVGDVGSENMSSFRKIWDSDNLDDDDKGVIWDWIELFLNMSERYHNKFGCIEGWEFDLDTEMKHVEQLMSKYESP
jgi:hypothetical protein|tara:strand:- start:59 stop:523 length:465 start_codon:yes stop_codon:yes gene_type:complete